MKKLDYYAFIKAIVDRRIPAFGAGHGKFFLALTLYGVKKNGRIVITNEVF